MSRSPRRILSVRLISLVIAFTECVNVKEDRDTWGEDSTDLFGVLFTLFSFLTYLRVCVCVLHYFHVSTGQRPRCTEVLQSPLFTEDEILSPSPYDICTLYSFLPFS